MILLSKLPWDISLMPSDICLIYITNFFVRSRKQLINTIMPMVKFIIKASTALAPFRFQNPISSTKYMPIFITDKESKV